MGERLRQRSVRASSSHEERAAQARVADAGPIEKFANDLQLFDMLRKQRLQGRLGPRADDIQRPWPKCLRVSQLPQTDFWRIACFNLRGRKLCDISLRGCWACRAA